MKRSRLEFKVGLFVVMALAVLGVLAAKAGDFYLKPGYTVRMVFDAVSGIDTSSPVKLGGVTVGEVKDIKVIRSAEGKTEVEVQAFINQGVYLEDDARPRINTMGFLGEKYIEILPGTAGNPAITDGALLSGSEPSNVDDILNSGQHLIEKMQFTMDQVNQVVGDPEFKMHVKGTFTNADKVSANLIQTSEDLKDTMASAKTVMARLRDGEGTVGRLLKDDKIAKDIEAMVADLKAHPWKLFKKG